MQFDSQSFIIVETTFESASLCENDMVFCPKRWWEGRVGSVIMLVAFLTHGSVYCKFQSCWRETSVFFSASVTILCRELQLATVQFPDQIAMVPLSFHWWGVSLVFIGSGDVAELSGWELWCRWTISGHLWCALRNWVVDPLQLQFPFLKSTTISFVFSTFTGRLLWPYQVASCSTSSL